MPLDIQLRSKYKVVLLGDGSVGKTSLVKMFVHKKFDDKYLKTLGTNVYSKEIIINEDGLNNEVTMQIWDVLGQASFKNVIRSALNGAQGVIFVTDLTKRDSLVNLITWLKEFYEVQESGSQIFLGNKNDIQGKMFGITELDKFAKVYNGISFLTSAKTGENVDLAFDEMAKRLSMEIRSPNKDQVSFPKIPQNIDPKVRATDRIIDIFCKAMGGYEHSMPMVREQFKRLGVDFETANRKQLEALVDRFSQLTQNLRGEAASKEMTRKMKHALFEIE